MTDFDHRETTAHYDRLLAPLYVWMLGDLAAARRAAAQELAQLGVVVPASGQRASALDLGAGPGVHAVPLAELGYAVTAIDSSAELLAQLRQARSDVTTLVGDLTSAPALARGPFDVILCLGDTLCHLASRGAVRAELEALGLAVTAAPGAGWLKLAARRSPC